MEIAVAELGGGFEPVEDVEVEVVAAGGAVEDEGKGGDEGGGRDEDVWEAVARHGLSIGNGPDGVAFEAEGVGYNLGIGRE